MQRFLMSSQKDESFWQITFCPSLTQGAAGESELSSPEPQEPARALCEAAQLRAWGPVPLQAPQVAGKNPLSANILPVRECVSCPQSSSPNHPSKSY